MNESGSRSSSIRRAGIVVVLASLAGCAHIYVGADGSRNVVGFVHLKLPPAAEGATAGEALRARSVGLSLTSSEAGRALVLGYSDATLAFVRDNSVVGADCLLPGVAAVHDDGTHGE